MSDRSALELRYAAAALAVELDLLPSAFLQRDAQDDARVGRAMLAWILYHVHGWSTLQIRQHMDGIGDAILANIRSLDFAMRVTSSSFRRTISNVLWRMDQWSLQRAGETP